MKLFHIFQFVTFFKIAIIQNTYINKIKEFYLKYEIAYVFARRHN